MSNTQVADRPAEMEYLANGMELAACEHSEEIMTAGLQGIIHATCQNCGQCRRYIPGDEESIVVTKLGRIDGVIVLPPAGTRFDITPEDTRLVKEGWDLLNGISLLVREGKNIINETSPEPVTPNTPLRARKKESISRKNNFYTARLLAQVLGVHDSKTIVSWTKKGWLKGQRSGKSQRKNRLWCFTEEEIVSCLKKNPWLVDLDCMEEHYFRSVVQKEWERDPWYTAEQVCPLLGIGRSSLYKYIRLGLLQVEKNPYLRTSWNRGVIARRSAIQAFLKRRSSLHSFLENDPVLPKESAARIAMKTGLISSGYPVKLSITWLLECPSCRQKVKIAARPELNRLQVREHFITVYVNGSCMHGATCQLP